MMCLSGRESDERSCPKLSRNYHRYSLSNGTDQLQLQNIAFSPSKVWFSGKRYLRFLEPNLNHFVTMI